MLISVTVYIQYARVYRALLDTGIITYIMRKKKQRKRQEWGGGEERA